MNAQYVHCTVSSQKKQTKKKKTVTSCIYPTKVEGKVLPLDINMIKIISSGMVIYFHTYHECLIGLRLDKMGSWQAILECCQLYDMGHYPVRGPMTCH